MAEKALLARDVKRDIGAELLQSERALKAGASCSPPPAGRLPVTGVHIDARLVTSPPYSAYIVAYCDAEREGFHPGPRQPGRAKGAPGRSKISQYRRTAFYPAVDFHPILTRGFHLKLTHGLCA